MKKLFLNIAAVISMTSAATSQNETDALRYSQQFYGGTARSTAMGGAFGSLGADMNVLSVNPAGIGIYKDIDISFTPSFFYQTTTSSYNNNLNADSRYTLNFNSLGLVFSNKRKHEGSLLHNLAFGIAYNRLNNFTNAIRIESENNNSSILDMYVDRANGNNPIELYDGEHLFGEGLAYDLYLLDTIPGDTTNYFSVVPNGGTTQQKYIETSGGMGETAMTLGWMVGDRLYMGATLGFPTVRYVEYSTYQETDEKDTISTIDHFEVYEHLSTTGSGLNVKFGLIYRLTNFARLGMAVHSPSVLSLTDRYDTEIDRTFDDGSSASLSTFDFYSEGGIYSYTLTTPMRLTAGLSFLIGRIAAISADYEFVDYSTARLSATDDYGFFEENDAINTSYKASNNFRVGTEWKIKPIALRAGYAYYGSPYTSEIDNDGSRSIYSVGIGLREKQYYVDFTYALSQKTDKYYMYDPDFADAAATNLATSHTFMTTLGFRF